VAFGLYLVQWWFGLRYLERLGQLLWHRLQPLAARFRQRHSSYASLFGAGMLWGWLPCGLVYSALSWAAISGSGKQGGLYMAAFGLGTLPAMFAFGWLSHNLQQLLKSKGFPQLLGALMIVLGLRALHMALRQVQLLSPAGQVAEVELGPKSVPFATVELFAGLREGKSGASCARPIATTRP